MGFRRNKRLPSPKLLITDSSRAKNRNNQNLQHPLKKIKAESGGNTQAESEGNTQAESEDNIEAKTQAKQA
ncbi:MAG: hypothetical protein HAW61_02925 [Candidatus Portiera sp.]|nr:hypothetical protein [Portiera sp.]